MQDAALRFASGDRVRNTARPEWGIGLVHRAVDVPGAKGSTQRLTIRFPNVGQKTLNAAVAPLVHADAVLSNGSSEEINNPFDEAHADGWLKDVAAQKVEEHMTVLPMEATDPFSSPESRLRHTLALFRFEHTPRGLIDWAVAQSQLDDPLARFSRHELETFFERWEQVREAALRANLKEALAAGVDLAAVLGQAAPAARDSVRRLIAQR